MANLSKFEIKAWYTDGNIETWYTIAKNRYQLLNQFIFNKALNNDTEKLKLLSKIEINEKELIK